jgi:tetratricopeptide (TPR) repeat protein
LTLRADLVLTAAIALVFGLAAGLLIGHSLGGGAPRPAPAAEVANEHDAHLDPDEARRMLALHEELLARSPEDVGLLQTVGEYRTLAGDLDGALAAYTQAVDLASARGAAPSALADLVLRVGVVQVERGEIGEGLESFDEAAALDPGDVSSRLSSVWVLVNRVMMAPPPGWTRKDAVARAEALIAEVLAIDPAQPDALELRQLIDAMRRTAPGAAAPGAAAP